MKKTISSIVVFLLTIMFCAAMSTYALAEDGSTTNNSTIDSTTVLSPDMEYRAEVLRLVNIERANAGVAELIEMKGLQPMADIRAKESATSFSHTRPNGTRFCAIFKDYSITYSYAGENLAYGFSTPERLVTAWMNSESHRSNLLNPNFTYSSVGYYKNANGRIYCSLLFYTPRTVNNQ